MHLGTLPIASLVMLSLITTGLILTLLRCTARLHKIAAQNRAYAAIFEALPDSLNAKDRQSRFLVANAATARLMQTAKAKNLIGKSDADFYDEAMARAFRNEELRVLNGQIVGPIQQEVLVPDGSSRWLETLKSPMRDPQGHVCGIITYNRDITERQRLETELGRSRADLTAAVANMADGLVLYDRKGTVRFSNQQYRDLFPITADLRVAGNNFRDIARAAVLRGEETPSNDIEAWIDGRLTALQRPGERSIKLADGRQIEVRTRAIDDGGSLLTFSDISELKLREAEAQEANRLLLMAEEVAHVGHWRVELPSNIVTWSAEVYRIHGLDPTVFTPDVETAIDLYHPDDRAEVQQHVSTALKTLESFEFKLRILHTDGDVRYVQSRGRCEVDAATGTLTSLFGVFLDMTELARTERRLREQSNLLQATLDNMEQGLVKVDPNRKIELWNRRFGELLELPLEILIGDHPHFDDVMIYLDVRGEFAQAPEELRQRVRDRGKPLVIGTHERVRPNGQILEVITSPLSDGSVVATYTDITARRTAERGLRESEARYRMLADTTSDVITQLDLNLIRRYVSPGCRSMLGYEPEDMLNMTPSVLIHPEDAAAVRNVMELLAAGAVPGDKSTVTNRMRHKAGHWVWLEAAINLVRDPDTGAPNALVCSLRDVTERQRAARHLERAKAIAENAARIKADFVANMSHELRTPLTGILGVHDLLKSDPDLTARQSRYLDIAAQAGRSLLTIVNDVLDFSKIEAGRLSIEKIPFDVVEVLTTCRDFVGTEAQRKSLRLEEDIEGPGAPLVGDPNRLRQIILNLLTNAIKFTEAGAVILKARYVGQEGRLHVEVSDTGIGIAEDKLSLMFGRFSQADTSITRRYGGTGLGLAICKRLIELMGGEIGVNSAPGRGSTFWFVIPLAIAEPGAQLHLHDESHPVSQPKRVLLAEDNLINQEMIVAMIETRGHKVTAVGNGVAAVEAARVGGFDIILMDMQMPVMDGLSASRAIRLAEKTRGGVRTPIIGLTANALAEDIHSCREAGMDAHVAKPIEWTELFTTMDRLAVPPQQQAANSVLEPEKLEDLARYIGQERLTQMLERFVIELEKRLPVLGSFTVADLATETHMLRAMAGQFGFMELSNLCAEIEGEARQGAGLNRLPDLAAAGERALAAAKASIGSQ